MESKIKLFLNKLEELQEKKEIQILYRGISKKDAFGVFKIDLEDYKIEQFSQKLFFYGSKSVYFIRDKYKRDFDIHDISTEIFEFIFLEFHALKKVKNQRTKEFISKNQKIFEFFFDKKNKQDFINNVLAQKEDNIIITRNYLLSILHQIGNFTRYKKKSHFLSSSSREEVAKQFSDDDLIIKFWKPVFNKTEYKGIYCFDSFVYPEQEEYSVFSAIFPHYIFSFTFKGKEYFNPYINTCSFIDYCIYFGFDINQDNFIPKLYSETIHTRGVQQDSSGKMREI